MRVREIVHVRQGNRFRRFPDGAAEGQMHMVGKNRGTRQPMLFPSGNAQNHVASLRQPIFANFAPAAIVDQHQMKVEKIPAVRTEDRLGEIDFGEINLEGRQTLLDAVVSHAVMAQLTCDIVLDYFLPHLANAAEREVPPERRRARTADRNAANVP